MSGDRNVGMSVKMPRQFRESQQSVRGHGGLDKQ